MDFVTIETSRTIVGANFKDGYFPLLKKTVYTPVAWNSEGFRGLRYNIEGSIGDIQFSNMKSLAIPSKF